MKSIKNTSQRKKPLTVLAVVASVFLIAGVSFALYLPTLNSTDNKQTGPTAEQTEEQKKTEADSKKEFVESTKDEVLPGTTPATPTSSDSINLSATQDAGTVTVTSKLSGYSAGSCRLTITNGASSLSENADIIYQPEYSSCAGFSIVKSRLGTGTWDITLYATPSGGSELSKNIKYTVR